jgi:hypothetical protein
MSARVWTKEKLDDVWPVKGWTWGRISGRVWALYCDAEPNQHVCMSVLGRLHLSDKVIPPTAALTAIIGVHEGRDSMEAMARAMTDAANDMTERSRVGGGFSDTVHAAIAQGRAVQAVEVAEMLRRGTVQS